MFRKAVALTPVALVGAGIALTLAGCGTPAASAAGQGPTTAAHQVAAQRQAGTAAHAVQPQPLAATQRAEATKQAAGTTAPPAGAADSEATATATPAASSPGSSSRPAGTPSAAAAETLPAGLYEDGQEGTPRYVLALTHTAPAVIVGSVEYFYQDGRTASAGRYTGTLAGSSGMTLRFADGKAVTAIYHGTTLTITDCAAALPFATQSGACTFTFHGSKA